MVSIAQLALRQLEQTCIYHVDHDSNRLHELESWPHTQEFPILSFLGATFTAELPRLLNLPSRKRHPDLLHEPVSLLDLHDDVRASILQLHLYDPNCLPLSYLRRGPTDESHSKQLDPCQGERRTSAAQP